MNKSAANHAIQVFYTDGEILAYYRPSLEEAVKLANDELQWEGTSSVSIFSPDQKVILKTNNINY